MIMTTTMASSLLRRTRNCCPLSSPPYLGCVRGTTSGGLQQHLQASQLSSCPSSLSVVSSRFSRTAGNGSTARLIDVPTRTHLRLASLTTATRTKPFSTSSSHLNDNDDELSPHQQLLHAPVTQFTEDEQMIQDSVRQWARHDVAPLVRDMDNAGRLDDTILQGLFEQGLMGMEIPVQYTGGSGLSFTAACLAVEEIARVDPSVAILVDIHNTLTINAVRFWGSKDLQEQWLPRLATDTVSSFCLSEADSGSDAFSMKTTATPSSDSDNPDSYTLNGTKMWISNAQQAGVFLVFANANPKLGYKGITAFMVDATTPGITVGKPEDKLGLRASSTCPVIFDEVVVDASQVLGDVGMGYKYCIEILNEGRIGIAAQQIGIAKGCFDLVMPYLQERHQFGQPIGDFQGMQHQVAALATELHAAEVMTYNACRLKEHGQRPFIKQASMAKLYASQVAERVASKTIEWLGGIGFTKTLLAEKFFRDCKVGSIYEGTSNIQLQTIAKILNQEYKS